MRVLGIDPGVEKTGFCVLEKNQGKMTLLDWGTILTVKGDSLPIRLNQLRADLERIIAAWKPSHAGVEQLFFSKNVKTALMVCHGRGVILELLAQHNISITELNPATIKQTVTGDSKADKKQIQKMVHYHLGVHSIKDDAIDAIATALCLSAQIR